jgi:hypothetical protein
MVEITSSYIQDKVYSRFINHDYKLRNTFIFEWESDFFSITKSNYVYEVEIKVSRSDFKADFNKYKKHQILSAKGNKVVIRGWELTEILKDGTKVPSTSISIRDTNKLRPNKFYYACPVGLLKKEEIPEYAGLIEVSEHGAIIIKEAPYLHKETLDLQKELLSKFYWLAINRQTMLESQEKTIKRLETVIKTHQIQL